MSAVYTEFLKDYLIDKLEEIGAIGTDEPYTALHDIALIVIRGDYGNGAERKKKLTDAGYDYDKVQADVNYIVKGWTNKTAEELTDDEIISISSKNLLQNYPIFDDEYRTGLNKKIFYHYYLREIGAETPERFEFYLRRTMNENMPYFNKLYKSELLKFDPLFTVNRIVSHKGSGTDNGTSTTKMDSTGTTTENGENTSKYSATGSEKATGNSTGTTNGNNTTESTSSSANKAGVLDTPQGSISAIGSALSTTGNGYLTNAQLSSTDSNGNSSGTSKTTTEDNSSSSRDTTASNEASGTDKKTTSSTDNANSTAENSSQSTDEYLDTITGYEGHPAVLIKELRDTFLNLDMEVIDGLADCFMMIY